MDAEQLAEIMERDARWHRVTRGVFGEQAALDRRALLAFTLEQHRLLKAAREELERLQKALDAAHRNEGKRKR